MKAFSELLDPRNKIVIGESATRIPEGEPLLYPSLADLLVLLRRKYPETMVQITTNGIKLSDEMAEVFSELRPLEVVVSLNSSTPRGRQLLMGDREPERVIRGVEALARHGVPFHGSVVAMPELVGWEDIEQTIGFLAENGCRTVRLLMPGYTEWGKSRGQFAGFTLAGWPDILPWLEDARSRLEPPIVPEPAIWSADCKDNLVPLHGRVEGVIKGSPAWEVGIRGGDEILRVDGQKVLSRVDAFNRVRKADCPQITIIRGGDKSGRETDLKIVKAAGQTSGLVMYHDIDTRLAQRVLDCASIGPSLVLTSTLAYPVLSSAFRIWDSSSDIHLQIAPNRFLGGNIGCAGLLTVEDFIYGYKEFERDNPGIKVLQVLVPEAAFDHQGKDLTGRGYWELQSSIGLPVRCI